MSLVIYQDEASKWGPNPLRAMYEAKKERDRKWAREAAEAAKEAERLNWNSAVEQEARRQRALALAAEEKALQAAAKAERVRAAKERIPWDNFTLMRDLVARVAKAYDVTPDAIYGQRRSPPELIMARHIAVYLVCVNTEWSLPRIARFFNRDHTTCLFARDKITSMITHDADLAHTVALLELGENGEETKMATAAVP